jgi:hypothetical protein
VKFRASLFFPTLLGTTLMAVLPTEVSSACAPDSAVVIYYGNGMFITPARARVQALLMDRKLRSTLPARTKVTFAYSYNNSEDSYDQLFQVAGQALLGKSALGIPDIPSVPSVPSVPSLPSTPSVPSLPSWPNLPSSIGEAVRTLEKSANADSYVKDRDLNAHVARYQADLAAGRRVIVLAHSQGNFYANRAYDALSSKAGFAIVSIGTPASYTAGSGPYTTLTTDEIISSIPNRRTPNTTNGHIFNGATSDGDGHSFTRHYLNGDVAGPKITGQVNTVLASLSCPTTP